YSCKSQYKERGNGESIVGECVLQGLKHDHRRRRYQAGAGRHYPLERGPYHTIAFQPLPKSNHEEYQERTGQKYSESGHQGSENLASYTVLAHRKGTDITTE